MNWYVKVLKNYAVFSGRARRKEYWMFALFNFIFALVLSLIGVLTFGMLYILAILYGVAVFVPALAVAVRRLHDIGKSGWYYFIILIPLAGPIWLLVLMCTDSQPGGNKSGPNPKEEEESGKAIPPGSEQGH